MGVESYFVNAKIKDGCTAKDVLKIIESNNSLEVIPFDKLNAKKSYIFITDKDCIISKVVKFSIIDLQTKSLQACFSCYEKSLEIIAEIILTIMEANISEYFFYCDRRFDFSNCEKSKIINILDNQMHNRHLYFLNNFTQQRFDVLPDDFYSYYDSHRKELKHK